MDAHYKGLLSHILHNPGDDFARLVMADWLEERGDPRGEFIRVGVALAVAEKKRDELEAIILTDEFRYDLHSELIKETIETARELRKRELELYREHHHGWKLPSEERLHTEYHRGFINWIGCASTTWLMHGSEIVRLHPVQTVMLSNKTPQFLYRERKFSWHRETVSQEFHASHLSAELFERLWADTNQPPAESWGYDTIEEAFTALSVACINWARRPEE